MKNKTFTFLEKGVETKVEATSQQSAANAYFGVVRAIRPMAAFGIVWANHRHSKHSPARSAQIVSAS
jgi:hypothetical protein